MKERSASITSKLIDVETARVSEYVFTTYKKKVAFSVRVLVFVNIVSKRISVGTAVENHFVNITVIDTTVRTVREVAYVFITNKRLDA